jgi:hypothetical protein
MPENKKKHETQILWIREEKRKTDIPQTLDYISLPYSAFSNKIGMLLDLHQVEVDIYHKFLRCFLYDHHQAQP